MFLLERFCLPTIQNFFLSLLNTTIFKLKNNFMKQFYFLMLFLFISFNLKAQSNPVPFNLAESDYEMTQWSSDAAAGTYPASMVFHIHSSTNSPLLEDETDGDWLCTYNITSRSRVIGQGDSGFSFLNTGDIQNDQNRCGGGPDDTGGYIGGAVLALNTTNVTNITLSYVLNLIAQAADTRFYDVRLQYRFNTQDTWTDVPDAELFTAEGLDSGFSNEYTIELSEEFENRELLQIRWKYYQTSAEGSGSRPHIGFDEIRVTGETSTSTRDRIKQAKPFSFFPNPVTGDYIYFNEQVDFTVFDISGRMIKQVKSVERFYVGDLQGGVYIMRNELGNVSKFIKR